MESENSHLTQHPGHRGLLSFFSLRPYGERMSSPAVTFWIRAAWSVIILMALVEASIWGLIGRQLAPGNNPWIDYPVALFAFSGIFMLIWFVDSSFILAERPLLRKKKNETGEGIRHRIEFDSNSPWRWRIGISARILIVLISLLVTAPLLTLVIRTDQINELFEQKLAAADASQSEGRVFQSRQSLPAAASMCWFNAATGRWLRGLRWSLSPLLGS